MKTVKDFLTAYVKKYGSANVVSTGDIDISRLSIPGVKKVEKASDANVYVVADAPIDGDIVDEVDTIVYTADPLNLRPANQPEAGMARKPHGKVRVSDTVMVYTTVEFPDREPLVAEPEVEPDVYVADELEEEQTPPRDAGVPFSISGAETADEEEEDEGESNIPPIEPKVW